MFKSLFQALPFRAKLGIFRREKHGAVSVFSGPTGIAELLTGECTALQCFQVRGVKTQSGGAVCVGIGELVELEAGEAGIGECSSGVMELDGVLIALFGGGELLLLEELIATGTQL